MKRYWVPQDWLGEEEVSLSGDIYHHIHKVCRNDVGAKFELLCGDHKAYFVELIEAGKKSGKAKRLEVREIPPVAKPYIHLAVSIPRFHKFDFIVEKAVELGVFAIHPFVSDYSFVKKVDSSLERKRERWKKIVQGATQQSGRGDLMEVCSSHTLDQVLDEFNQRPNAAGLFPYEGECPLSVRDAIGQIRPKSAEAALEELWLFVGSEGGFSSPEVVKFQELGLSPATLGEQVLRVDTACMALVTILKYEFHLLEGK
jgi:16S rRNA (uracil1498-N3)-methyltransferase